jgi:uncharacterized membrane protein
MLDEIVSDTDRALVPVQPAAPDIPAVPPPDMKVQPGAAMFGAVPLRDPEKFVADAAGPSVPPDLAAPELKIQSTDVRGSSPRQPAEKAAAREGPSFFARILGYGARAIVIACLCALAYAAGAFYSSSHSPIGAAKPAQLAQVPPVADVPPNAGHDDMVNAMRQMTDEMRALKADVAQSANQSANAQANAAAAPVAAGASNADVMGRIDKLDAEFTARLSQVDQQLASIEHQMAASHAAAVARIAALHKHPKPHPHDAFDPTHDPAAVGAPHPLGMQ